MDTKLETRRVSATLNTTPQQDFIFRQPHKDDGFQIHQLIADCPPLDPNSIYCNLLQCNHFANTCVLAELDGQLMGFVSGYRIPSEPNTLFIWQIAVHADARGLGLGKKMIHSLLRRRDCIGVNQLKTTITPDNAASWGMFRSLAKELGASVHDEVEYESDTHFGGQHDEEVLLTISPIRTNRGSLS